MLTPLSVNFRDFLNKDSPYQTWFCKSLATLDQADTTDGLKYVASLSTA